MTIICRVVEDSGPAPSSIVEALSGSTVLLTGVTGFLGQVVFEMDRAYVRRAASVVAGVLSRGMTAGPEA